MKPRKSILKKGLTVGHSRPAKAGVTHHNTDPKVSNLGAADLTTEVSTGSTSGYHVNIVAMATNNIYRYLLNLS